MAVDGNISNGTPGKFAYVTVITRASYLPGIILLAHSLYETGTKYPLIVLYTSGLPERGVQALQNEASIVQVLLLPTTLLELPNGAKPFLIAARFADTWTKLRVFLEPALQGYEKLCHVDADALMMRNMDDIFLTELSNGPVRGTKGIAAAHACVCNPDNEPWAPPSWNVANCAYTPLSHPEALTKGTSITTGSPETYSLLNSGVFLFEPTAALEAYVLNFFKSNSKEVATYKFPDQDFLTEAFRGHWSPLSWKYNAIKTMKYFHRNIWRDNEVVFLHFIVDKPWSARIHDDKAGYRGRDGVTHRWWWEQFEKWKIDRQSRGTQHQESVVTIEACCANIEGGSEDQDLKDIGIDVQGYAHRKLT